jgi:D-alanyl-D-alanine carboxypeptidase (penicillin-binding protein 5/6)
MWNSKLFHEFFSSLNKLDPSRQFLAASCMLLVLLYPGQNYLQKIIINPGKVRSYSFPISQSVIYPRSDNIAAPRLSARSIIVQDAVSKTIMYAKNPDSKLMPASITKIMTALVALDHWTDLETIIEVKNEDRAIGQTIKLEKGERITLKNILYGLLVHSGNDAALAVADNYCAPSVAEGEVGSCGYSAFVDAMNAKAAELHLDNTTFKNPSGIEQYGHLTTARDLAILAASALQNPVIADMAQTKHVVVTDVTGLIIHDLETTNELLGVIPGMKGLKTGWTTNAGECLISYVDRDGHKIIIVVLGSLDRFGDTTKLVDWVYSHHNWITPEL